ncbi:carbohydrate sulfotransferase 15-like isoform X2 [Physella acuta]|uniref:carbohydrate sulfotransferase 15-like isoform X2 n=1 Tax=Physella acuta TaxID=109671 RepID=UPI0027DBC6A9|nr:carbohydrate sulfotransferase 15-like isoform X2 [Physella acuta]
MTPSCARVRLWVPPLPTMQRDKLQFGFYVLAVLSAAIVFLLVYGFPVSPALPGSIPDSNPRPWNAGRPGLVERLMTYLQREDSPQDVLKDQLSNEIPAGPERNSSGRRIHGSVPVACRTNDVSEVLAMPIKFLPEYKNPCWREEVVQPADDMYHGNLFANYSYRYEKIFRTFRQQWAKRLDRFRLRCLPYFFIAGMPKCGSTDLYHRLIAHPDVAAPPVKESHWWGKNRYGWCLNYTSHIPFSDYVDLFDGAAMQIADSNPEGHDLNTFHTKITGDASVSTLWANEDWWKNPENCGLLEPRFTNAHYLHHVIPQARVIVLLRNPTDRLYSDFLFFHQLEKSPQDFHRDVESSIHQLTQCMQEMGVRNCIYNSSLSSNSRVRLRLGLYHVYLQEWLTQFPRNQVTVIRLEDYAARPLLTIKHVRKFLGLRELTEREDKVILRQPKVNTRRLSDRKLGRMLASTRELLDNFYRPYNVKLALLLEDDRFLWNDVEYI